MRFASTCLTVLGILATGLSLPAPSASAAMQLAVAPPSAFVDRWLGNFKFAEAVPGTVFTYEVALISSRDGDFVGDVTVQGRMVDMALHCDVVPNVAANSLTFVYRGNNAPLTPPEGWYKLGDRLFTLKQSGRTLSTTWLKMKPQLPRRAWDGPGFTRLDHGRP